MFALGVIGMYTRDIKHPGRGHTMSKRIGRYVWAEPGDIYVITEHIRGDLYGIRFHTGSTTEFADEHPTLTARVTGRIEPGAWPFNDDTLNAVILSDCGAELPAGPCVNQANHLGGHDAR